MPSQKREDVLANVFGLEQAALDELLSDFYMRGFIDALELLCPQGLDQESKDRMSMYMTHKYLNYMRSNLV